MAGILNMIATAFKAAVSTGDAFFNLVTLLLNTSSTNGAQNNTFLDSSSIGNTVTRNGTPTQGTFTPFSQTGWSNYFGATGTYLTVTSQPLINVNDWTVEFWMYPTQFNNNGGIFGASNGGGTNPKLYLYVTGANLIIEGYSSGFFTALSTALPPLNQWTYVSVSRASSNGNAYLYYNGVLQGSAAAVPAITGITGGFSLLSNGEGSSAGFYGYISNVRVSNVARYTGSSYSVPTAASTAIANTTLLTAQSNRFVDNSTNGYAIAVTGTPSIQAFSPFLPTAAYDTAVVGGSGLFVRANSDILTLPNNSLLVGSSDFSLETWAYQFDRSGSMNFFGNQTDRATAGGSSWNIAFTNTNGYLESTTWVGGTPYNLTTSTAPPLNAWNHIVWCRTGGTQSIFVNGVRGATRSDMGTLSVNNGSTSFPPAIGANGGSASDILNGYLSGFKIIIGSGGYDATASTLTIPTAPPTNTTNTKLLVNFTNAGIFDSAAKNDLQTVGNAQVSTTQAKWGTTSMYFDGTGDYLVAPQLPINSLGSGNFSIEGWFYCTGYNGGAAIYSGINTYPSSAGLLFYINGSGTYTVDVGGSNVIASGTAPLNTWTYFALVRSGSTITLYINGSSVSSGSNSTNFTSQYLTVGRTGAGTASNYYLGYLDDIRITNGYARTISASPTAAFPLQ